MCGYLDKQYFHMLAIRFLENEQPTPSIHEERTMVSRHFTFAILRKFIISIF